MKIKETEVYVFLCWVWGRWTVRQKCDWTNRVWPNGNKLKEFSQACLFRFFLAVLCDILSLGYKAGHLSHEGLQGRRVGKGQNYLHNFHGLLQGRKERGRWA